MELPPGNCEPYLRDIGNSNSGHVCTGQQQHSSSPDYVSDPRASSTGDSCSVTELAGKVDVHVSTVSPTKQSHSETWVHSGGRGNTNSPLVAVTAVVSTPAPSVCGPPSHHSLPPGPNVTTGVCLGWQVIPSALMEALMQHYQAAEFSKEVCIAYSWKLLEDPQQTEYMTTGGFASLTGLKDKELIRFLWLPPLSWNRQTALP